LSRRLRGSLAEATTITTWGTSGMPARMAAQACSRAATRRLAAWSTDGVAVMNGVRYVEVPGIGIATLPNEAPVHRFGFPHAAQVLQVTRKRTVGGSHASTGRRRWRTVTIYAITSLGFAQASPARLADLLRGHRAIEALHHLRDVTFCEDASQLRTGAGPHVMATWRNLVIGVLCRAGPVNLAAALRRHARDPHRPLATLGISLG
jgi:hypothetical protein